MRRKFKKLKQEIPSLDVELAKDGLVYADGLGTTVVRTGCVILEHLNRKTGQCDPGIDRIAELVGKSKSTIYRALKVLCDGPDPYIFRAVHEGTFYKNQYKPNMPKLVAIAHELQTKAGIRKIPAADEGLQPMTPSTCQQVTPNRCHPVTPKPDLQPTKKPTKGRSSDEIAYGDQQSSYKGTYERLIRTKFGDGTDSASKADVARKKAEERLTKDILSNGHSDLFEILTEGSEAYESAVAAEMNKPGSGLVALLEHLR